MSSKGTPRNKLDPKTVMEIHSKYFEGFSVLDLVKDYKVSYTTISSILTGKSWKRLGLQTVKSLKDWDRSPTGFINRYVDELTSRSLESFGDECLPWPFTLTEAGYGRVRLEGKVTSHHRALWIRRYGPIAKDLHVRHKCRLKSCSNPNHHEVGTAKQNVHDKFRDGTMINGENSPLSKLTDFEVEDIARRVQNRERYTDIAKEYKIHPQTVARIVTKGTWKHLELPDKLENHTPRGERHSKAKLTESDVIRIFEEFNSGRTQSSLAEEYDVGNTTIYNIVNGQTWKHLELGKART